MIDELHMRDGAGDGPHAHANGAGLERRSRGSRGAHHAASISDRDLAIGSQVNQRDQAVAARDAGGNNAGQSVGADEPAKAARKTDGASLTEIPAKLPRSESLFGQMRRLEGHVRQGFH